MAAGRRPAWVPVFGVIFPTVVGGGILALPVALAPLGPILAVGATIALGLVNTLTIGLLSLAVVRRADSLPPEGRFASLAGQLLGRPNGRLTAIVIAILELGLVVAYALGLGYSLSHDFGMPPAMWASIALLISITLVALQKRRALMTAGSAVTVINLVLLATIILILSTHLDFDLLTSGPPAPLQVASWTLVFGALMGAFFGHTAIPTIAPSALRADPTGRSLITGSVSAMLAATVVTSLWVLVTLGSTPAADYGSATSTGIHLVGEVGGRLAGVLAMAFILLALGVAGMISSFILGDLAVEQVPIPRALDLDLSRGVLLHAHDGSRDGAVVTLSASPVDGTVLARATRGRQSATEQVVGSPWDARRLLAEVGGRRPGRWLRVTTTGTRVRVRTTMVLEIGYQHASSTALLLDEGISARVLGMLIRQPRTTADLAGVLGVPDVDVQSVLESLCDEGLADPDAAGTWHAHLGHRRTATAAHGGALPTSPSAGSIDMAPRSPAWLATTGAARGVAALPLVVALLAVLALLATDATFTRFFSLIGIGPFVFIGTVVPLLLAVASTRNADRMVPTWLASIPAWVMWTLWAAVTLTCLTYATVIYRAVPDRLAAGFAVVISVLATVLAVRARSFRGAAWVVVGVDAQGRVSARLTNAGRAGQVTCPAQIPQSGSTLRVVLDARLTGPLRIVAESDDSPHPLGALRVTSRHRTLSAHRDGVTGITTVPIEGAEPPIEMIWQVD